MISFLKEKKKNKSVTYKSIFSKNYCLHLVMFCWPFLADKVISL